MIAESELDAADHLLNPGGSERSSRANLCAAVVVVYYALFHAVCECFADLLAGTSEDVRDEAAWEQAYRMPDHRRLRVACKKSLAMLHFPADLRELSKILINVQFDRIQASYSSNPSFSHSEALEHVNNARMAINNLKNSNIHNHRTFITWLVLPERGN